MANEKSSCLKLDNEMRNQLVHAPVLVEGFDASAYGIARSLGRHGISINALDGKNKWRPGGRGVGWTAGVVSPKIT